MTIDETTSGIPWHTLSNEATTQELEVTPAQGLSSAEAARRLKKYGANVLTGQAKEPGWQAFLRQYQDYMQIILLAAAVASLFIGDVSTALMLFALTLLNAVLGLRQESKAEESVAALQKMMKITARVRRDGQIAEIEARQIVPGDIVIFEAGDRVPADGRLLVAATLEIEEAALTGESTPVLKDTDAITEVDLPLGDRLNMGYMNSSVTRGRGEMLVTGTGMNTEVGHIAHMLQSTEDEKAPLTRQVDRLTVLIASLAGVTLLTIVVVGLFRGQAFSDLYVLAISLAIAAIPTGLPVVVTAVLSMGTMALAQRNAIVKNLPAVETLGSTSAICSDKTGTLTLNQMTAKELVIALHKYKVDGEGYDTSGRIQHIGGVAEPELDPFLLPMVLCADAEIDDGNLVGDPTEGALVVLAAKGGIDIRGTRSQFPRIAEVPFDSAYKLMATFHNVANSEGQPVVRCFVKGAPDILIGRSAFFRGPKGKIVPIDDEIRQKALAENERLAAQGMRVMVVARRDFDPATFDPHADLLALVNELTFLAMAGIVDPPRPEARTAIAECREAGIRVRMITGDHKVTAAAIAEQLGIEGRAITGAEFKAMNDAEVTSQIDEIGVIARVAPEDKVRLVKVLQAKNNIVAMTGDGVNDAPALKTSDIGVAMGITGTDVSKEAATMILTDDNFATIVGAVEEGRTIYDNLLKYIRFQMAGLFAFILAFLGAVVFGISFALFTPLQILFVNFIIQAPIGAALGFDSPTPGLMQRKPRPADESILPRAMAIRLVIAGLVIAIFSLLAYIWVENSTGSTAAAQTMAMVIFSIIHIPLALNLRYPYETVFQRETLSNPRLFFSFGWVLLALIFTTETRLLQRVFDTEALTAQNWAVCLIVAVGFFLVAELLKFIARLVVRD
jgi:Ca2+-transporting ATPase